MKLNMNGIDEVFKDYPKKEVECLKCGRVTQIPTVYTLKESWCKECGSLKIRLYKPTESTVEITPAKRGTEGRNERTNLNGENDEQG